MKLIKANGTIKTVLMNEDKRLDQLQKAVGGYIELVYLQGNKIMVVNEEGLIKRLPYNYKASKIAGKNIVGDVIICDVNEIN